MKFTTDNLTTEDPRLGTAGWLARMVLSRMSRVTEGSLVVEEEGRTHRMGSSRDDLPEAHIRVHDDRFWAAIARRGSIGAGEAYADGWWTSEDPTAVVRLFVRNREVLEGMEGGLARLSSPIQKVYHGLRKNTEKGSRANISAHYDVSNEFFALFLDETMTYSCGVFEREDSTLLEASVAKIDRLCKKLRLSPDDHLLEIGTGWGALAIHAASKYGCRVTTTTISREQHALAKERIQEAGLEDRITLLFEDYRNLKGTFSKLVSVEMIEAVGHAYYDTFFSTCAHLLEPDGLMALQAITIADQHYESAKRSVDFIQRHIFPGSCIPSVTALLQSSSRASDLRIVHLEDIGPHYAPTLAAWRKNLRARWEDARALGLTEEFLRMWEFYFCYCEGGFEERHISDVHMILQRPRGRQAPALAELG